MRFPVSRCKKDLTGLHRWESIGVIWMNGVQQVWKCSKCKLIHRENLDEEE